MLKIIIPTFTVDLFISLTVFELALGEMASENDLPLSSFLSSFP
jgi:hypothetical protein